MSVGYPWDYAICKTDSNRSCSLKELGRSVSLLKLVRVNMVLQLQQCVHGLAWNASSTWAQKMLVDKR